MTMARIWVDDDKQEDDERNGDDVMLLMCMERKRRGGGKHFDCKKKRCILLNCMKWKLPTQNQKNQWIP